MSRCEERATPISFSCSRSRSAFSSASRLMSFALRELDILESESQRFFHFFRRGVGGDVGEDRRGPSKAEAIQRPVIGANP